MSLDLIGVVDGINMAIVYVVGLQSAIKFWLKVKTVLKSIEKDFEPDAVMETMILTALSSVTAQDCQNWIEDCTFYA